MGAGTQLHAVLPPGIELIVISAMLRRIGAERDSNPPEEHQQDQQLTDSESKAPP
jgi:hypothetical protein